MIVYMNKKNAAGKTYIKELGTIGYSGTGAVAKFIYDNGNGESKTIMENNVLNFDSLFWKW